MKLLDKKYSPSNLEDRWYKYWLEYYFDET